MASEDTPRDPMFASEERGRLAQVFRLLTNVTDPDIVYRALNAGYTKRQHTEGQHLFALASGSTRPFDHALARIDRRQADNRKSVDDGRYAPVDDFENRWFAQAENLLRRHLSEADYAKLGEAFWLDLSQQPKGPAVVGSVALFLTRLDDLERATNEGVAEIFQAFEERGLTKAARTAMRATVTALGELPDPAPAPGEELAALEAADAEQRAAYAKLNRWYIDNAENLRGKLGYHDRVKLGISEVRGGKATGGDEGDGNLNEQ